LNILQSQDRYKTRLEIENILSALEISINQDDIVRILDKLVNDGYVIERKQDNNGTRIIPQYLISWSGHLFDSYDAKASRDAEALEQQRIDAARLIQLESQNLTNSGRLNILTHRLVKATWFAVGAAAVLFLWNVWIWFYPVHKDYPYWFWEKAPTKTSPKKS
ncbi:MAG: hypothetical protein ACXVB6_12820, partial [Mucilaginibacter sp.]